LANGGERAGGGNQQDHFGGNLRVVAGEAREKLRGEKALHRKNNVGREMVSIAHEP